MAGESLHDLLKESEDLDTPGFVDWALRKFGGTLAHATSLGAEDQVLLWFLDRSQARRDLPSQSLEIFTLDTGRLPQESYDVIAANLGRFDLPIHSYVPDAADVETLVSREGPNLFYNSVENRKECCRVRKVLPLKRALAGKTAWFTGLRRSQSVTRKDLNRIEWDETNGLWKLNPLLEWSGEEVWNLIREEKIPYNALHDKGFPSIGCAPCTRAVKPGEDERAGRWWWEQADQKECGIHVHEGPKSFVQIQKLQGV